MRNWKIMQEIMKCEKSRYQLVDQQDLSHFTKKNHTHTEERRLTVMSDIHTGVLAACCSPINKEFAYFLLA
jgi:hypothetical protein